MSSKLALRRHPLAMLAAAALLLALAGLPATRARAQGAEATKFSLVRFPTPIPAPHFQARTLGHAPLRLADFRGRYVLLNFWATWCPPCREEMADLNRFADAYQGHSTALILDREGRIRKLLLGRQRFEELEGRSRRTCRRG